MISEPALLAEILIDRCRIHSADSSRSRRNHLCHFGFTPAENFLRVSDPVVIIRTCVQVAAKRSSRSSTRLRPSYKRALDLTFDVLTTPNG